MDAEPSRSQPCDKYDLIDPPKEISVSALEHYPRITPFLWFHSNAEEAVEFYLTVFKNSRRLDKVRNTESEG